MLNRQRKSVGRFFRSMGRGVQDAVQRYQRKADKLAVGTAKSFKRSTENVVPVKQIKSVTRKAEKVATSSVKAVQDKVTSDKNVWRFRRWMKVITVPAALAGSMMAHLIPESWRMRLQKLSARVGKWFANLGAFLQSWIKSRNYWLLLRGIPAALLSTPLLLCMIAIPFYGADKKARRYRAAAEVATEEKEFEKAQLLYRKLAQLSESQRINYAAAEALLEEGDFDAAYAKMRELANIDGRGSYFPAVYWIAYQALFTDNIDLPENERQKTAEKHISKGLEMYPDHEMLKRFHVQLMLKQKRWKESIPLMKELVDHFPELGPDLVQANFVIGELPAARIAARNLIKAYQLRQKEGTRPLTGPEFNAWSKAAALVGDRAEAYRVANEGRQLHGDYQPLLTTYTLVALKTFEERCDDAAADRVLTELLMHNPSNAAAFQRFVALARQHGTQSDRIKQLVNSLDDEAKHWAYYGMASVEWVKGNQQLAKTYFEASYRIKDDNPMVANDLAYCVLETDGAYDRALELVNRALELDPGKAAFLETRGQLHLKLEQWEDAVRDLEAALNGLPQEEKAIHLGLTLAYSKLGEDELAEQHRKRAE